MREIGFLVIDGICTQELRAENLILDYRTIAATKLTSRFADCSDLAPKMRYYNYRYKRGEL